MTTTKQAILKAALPRVRAHSFTLTAIRGGITDHPEAGSKDPERLVDDIFGSKGEAEKELVRYWEEEGIRRMSDRGRGGQGETLRDVLGRRLGFSEESAGEGVVQAHAIIQSPRIRPFALNLPEAMGRMVDKMKAREGEGGWWEVYLPPGERGSSSLSSEAISSETPFASSSTIPLHPVTTKPPHHLPLPLPPNLFKSIAYAWKIADEALHLSAAPFALNDAGADGVGGRFEASKSDGGKDEVLRMGQGQGWEWYVRRGVLAGIYLRAESELMRPRASTQALTLPLERARAKLDVLLEGSYEPTVRRISLRGSGREQGAGESGGGGTRRREEVGTLGRFVWKSWGGLFRSRGWIG